MTEIIIGKFMEEQLKLVRKYETASAIVLGLKLSEEVGEFAEATLKECGYLPHKTLKEDSFHEGADIINTLLGTLEKLHPDLSTEDILQKLGEAVNTKMLKYTKILQPNVLATNTSCTGGAGDPVDTFGGSDF